MCAPTIFNPSEQMKKTLSNGIEGEDLDLLIGSRPYKDKDVW